MNSYALPFSLILFFTIIGIFGANLFFLPVYGHASPVDLNPRPNQIFETKQSLPSSVSITFTESPEPKASSLKVVDSKNQRVDKDDLKASDPGKSLSISLDQSKMTEGAYTVDWMVLSKADGHFTRGSYVFSLSPGQTQTLTQNSSQGQITNKSITSSYSKNMTVDGILLQFEIMPSKVGQNTFNLRTSFANGTAVSNINNVYMEFNNPEKNIGPIADTMDRVGQGNYTSTGSFLSQEGKWTIKLTIQRVGNYDINQQFDLDIR
jgi:methionine-rich copper-binding protein CopC